MRKQDVVQPSNYYLNKDRWISFGLFIQPFVGTLLIWAFGGRYDPKDSWYRNLKKPNVTPPNYVFPIVWPILYLLLAINGVYMYQNKPPALRRVYFILYEIQLFLNFIWILFFFQLKNLPAATGIAAAMVGLTIALVVMSFKVDKIAGILLLPYLAWISFALFLTVYILINNR